MNTSCSSSDECLEQPVKKESCSEDPTPTPSKFVCNKCNRAFTRKRNLQRHIGDLICSRPPKAEVIPDFTCSNCDYTFASKRNLQDHLEKQICFKNTIASVQSFTCSICEEEFASKQSLQRHVEKKICQKVSPEFTCLICEKEFASRQSLHRHVEKIICQKVPSKFTCSICEEEFASKHNLHRHVEKKICQKVSPNFTCSICEKQFASKHSLQRHVEKIICQKVPSKFMCSICRYEFASQQSLQRHVEKKICQKVSSKFRCSICNSEFATNYNLKRHVSLRICVEKNDLSTSKLVNPLTTKFVNQSTSKFVCPKCDCSFATYQSFQQHTHGRICSRNTKPVTPVIVYPAKKRRLETIFGDTFKNTPQDPVPEMQQTENGNLTEQFILDDSLTDAAADTVPEFKPVINENHYILGDDCTDVLDDPLQTPQQTVTENSAVESILDDSRTDATESMELPELPTPEPNPISELTDQIITIEDNVVETEPIVNHNPVTIWINESSPGLICPHCDREFTRERNLYWHIKDKICLKKSNKLAQKLGESLECPKCKRTFTKKQSMMHHILRRVCWEKIKRPDTPSAVPWRFPEQNPSTELKCPRCEKVFSRRRNLILHVHFKKCSKKLAPESDETTSLECPDCKRTFCNKQTVELHIEKRNCFEEEICPDPVIKKEKEEEDCMDEFDENDLSAVIENFDDLLFKFHRIKFPNTRWTCAIVAKNILITYWSPSFDCLKKIIIDQNLKITAFIKDVSIMMDETEARDLDAVKNVVNKLHAIKECAYNPAKSIRWKCRGFVEQNKEYCSSCDGEVEKDRVFQKNAN